MPLPVDADVSQAREALDRLKAYADQNAQFELKVATEKAQAAITNVEGMINALNRIQTESQHQVASNVGAVRAEIDSLNGRNTSSTHTIYVTKVETNATGGLVGVGVQRFADGGAVAPAFPRMSGGSVPGSGHHDTVPRTLEAGAFVIRKAAVQKYGIPSVVNQFLQRTLGRSVLLTQQRSETGINLESKFGSAHIPPQLFTSNRRKSASRFDSAISSCGTKTYFHGLPPTFLA